MRGKYNQRTLEIISSNVKRDEYIVVQYLFKELAAELLYISLNCIHPFLSRHLRQRHLVSCFQK